MCDPVTLAATALAASAASTAASYVGQGQQYAANKTAAGITYGQNQTAEMQRDTQVDAAQSQNTLTAAIADAKARGRVSASASSFGGDAASTTRDVQGSDFAAGRQLGIEDTNSTNSRLGIAMDSSNNFLRQQSQINSVAQANPASLGIGLAGDVASAGSTYHNLGGRF